MYTLHSESMTLIKRFRWLMFSSLFSRLQFIIWLRFTLENMYSFVYNSNKSNSNEDSLLDRKMILFCSSMRHQSEIVAFSWSKRFSDQISFVFFIHSESNTIYLLFSHASKLSFLFRTGRVQQVEYDVYRVVYDFGFWLAFANVKYQEYLSPVSEFLFFICSTHNLTVLLSRVFLLNRVYHFVYFF